MLGGVAAIAIVAALAAWQDGRRTQQALRTQIAQRLTELDAATQATAKAQTQLATDMRDTQAKIALLEARVAESQSQQAALDALYRDLAPSRDEIALTEIEQVLLVASQQLMLAGNVQSALAALQLADARLQRLERPQFLPLRRALTQDMDRLKAMPFVDVAGMSLKLDQALAAANALPFAMDERLPPPAPGATAAPADEPAWRRLAREVVGGDPATGARGGGRPAGRAAAPAVAAILPARKFEAAPADGTHRAAQPQRRELQDRSERGGDLASPLFRHPDQVGPDDAGDAEAARGNTHGR